jgi:GNAT superfamily N-acetyltransferase
MLANDRELNLYELGDLDDFFWPRTTWYALHPYEGVSPVVLHYASEPCPTVLALARAPTDMAVLLASLAGALPARFHAHLTPGVVEALYPTHSVHHDTSCMRMVLHGTPSPAGVDRPVRRLGPGDGPALRELYRLSYPDNWFDQRMLDTGMYFGILVDRQVVSVAGIHVYSPAYEVAALGNITTHPDYRGRGYGSAVTATLCQALRSQVKIIGLNVVQSNAAAVGMYRALGFEAVATFDEITADILTPGEDHEN